MNPWPLICVAFALTVTAFVVGGWRVVCFFSGHVLAYRCPECENDSVDDDGCCFACGVDSLVVCRRCALVENVESFEPRP